MRHLLKHAVLAIICLALPTLLMDQYRRVSGTVTDANNSPLQGVSVRVKNSNLGTSTDVSGRFYPHYPFCRRHAGIFFSRFQNTNYPGHFMNAHFHPHGGKMWEDWMKWW